MSPPTRHPAGVARTWILYRTAVDFLTRAIADTKSVPGVQLPRTGALSSAYRGYPLFGQHSGVLDTQGWLVEVEGAGHVWALRVTGVPAACGRCSRRSRPPQVEDAGLEVGSVAGVEFSRRGGGGLERRMRIDEQCAAWSDGASGCGRAASSTGQMGQCRVLRFRARLPRGL